LSMRNAQTIVRTATATVANQARMEFMEANNEVIKAWKWDATLDGRTRKEHADRDGALWDMNKEGINAKGKKYPFRYTPYGWNCRCQIVPVLKSWREMGFDEDELPVGTRSSLDGYVSQDMTFDKWLKTKSSEFQKEYLGAGRYELYSKGKITLSDLINQKGRYLSIKELKAISGEAVDKKEIFSKKSINKDTFETLKGWSLSGYRDIREAYYLGKERIGKNIMSEMFNKFEGNYNGDAFRGLGFNKEDGEAMKLFDKFKNLKIGDTYSDNAPSSFTKSPYIAEKFASVRIPQAESVVIHLKKYKTKGYDIEDISEIKSEKEVIFKDKISYNVVDKKYDEFGAIHITIEEK